MAYTFLDPWPFITRSRATSNEIVVTGDSWLNDSISNNGASATITCGWASMSGERKAIFQVDLSNIIYSEIDGEVYLTLYIGTWNVTETGASLAYTAREIQPSLVLTEAFTKATYNGTNAWPGGGAAGPIVGGARGAGGTDYIDTASDASTLLHTNTLSQNVKITNIVAAAIAAGQTSMWIMLTKDVDDDIFFNGESSESATPSFRPFVQGTFTPPGYGGIIQSPESLGAAGTTRQTLQLVAGYAFTGIDNNVEVKIRHGTSIDENGVIQSPTVTTAHDWGADSADVSDPLTLDGASKAINTVTSGQTNYYQLLWSVDGFTTTFEGPTRKFTHVPKSTDDTGIVFFGDDHLVAGLINSPTYPDSISETFRQSHSNVVTLVNQSATPVHRCVYIGDGPLFVQGANNRWPITVHGAPNSPDSYIPKSQDERNWAAALWRRYSRPATCYAPMDVVYGNRDRFHWWDDNANTSGTTLDNATWGQVTAKAYFGRPNGVGASADDETIAVGPNDRCYYEDFGKCRLVTIDFYRDSQTTLTANEESGADPLPQQPDAANRWRMHTDDKTFLYGASGPLQTFASSGLAWLVIKVHATPGDDQYSRDDVEEWEDNADMDELADNLDTYGNGRAIIFAGHNHFFWLSSRGLVRKFTLPMPLSYDKGLSVNAPSYMGIAANDLSKTIPPFVSNCGIVYVLFGSSSFRVTYYRTAADGTTVNPADGFVNNMDVVKSMNLGPLPAGGGRSRGRHRGRRWE